MIGFIRTGDTGTAIGILHRLLPVDECTDYEDVKYKLESLENEGDKRELILALFSLYNDFGHRTDGQPKPCLVCDGNPLGHD